MTHRRGGPLALLLLPLLPLLLAVAPLGAQQIEAGVELRGRVERGAEPVGGAEVVLHRVDAVEAGEVDTTFSAPDGSFLLPLPTIPNPAEGGEIYFASVEHQGVLYFGRPVATEAELDSLYRIEVFDSLQAPLAGAEIPIEVRYILLEETAEGWSVTDLIQLRVEGERTLVPAEEGVSWSYLLPPGISGLQVGGGDIAPAGTRFRGDTVGVTMPLSPGERQLVLRYRLDSLDLTLPLPGVTGQLEVLIRDPIPELELEGLVAVEPVQMEPGVVYRRYTAASLNDSTVRVRAIPGGGGIPFEWLVVVLALLLVGAGVWAVRYAPAGTASPASGGEAPPTSPSPLRGDERNRLLLRIATLDEEIEALPPSRAREALQEERTRLKWRLR